MTEATDTAAAPDELTLEEFVADMDADEVSEADSDETPAEEQPAEPEAEPEQMFDVNGEQVPVSELIGGYMKGADYTQKTQELATKREEAESMRATLERFYETPAVPEWQPQPPKGGLPSGEPTSLPEFATDAERQLFEKQQQTEQALSALQAESKQRQYREALQDVDKTFFGFKDSNPDLTDEQLVHISQTVRTRGYPYTQDSFDMVRKATMAPSADDIKKQAVADYIAEQKANKAKSEQAALEPGNAPATSEPPPNISNMTQEQVDALMLEDFKQQ